VFYIISDKPVNLCGATRRHLCHEDNTRINVNVNVNININININTNININAILIIVINTVIIRRKH